MIKTISLPQNMKIEDIIKLLEKLKEEQNKTLKLQYAEFLYFKCE